MADPQTSSPTPADSLPTSLINPEDMSYFAQPKSLLTTPLTQTASLSPQQPAPTPAPTPAPQPQPAPTPAPTPAPPPVTAAPKPPPAQPGQQPAVAPPTPLVPQQQPVPAPQPGTTQPKSAEPPLGSGVNWTGETDVLKQRVDQLYAAMPPELRSGTMVESGYRTYQQQEQIYAESDQGQKFMAASPGHSHHEQGTALDWHFGSPQAKQWLYENAPRFGLAFPFPDKDSGHMQLAEYGEGTQKGRAPQPGSANYLPELEKLIDSKEGGFPGAVSTKGAEGTHQILLTTAQEVEPGTTAESLQDPTVNDRIFHKIVRNLSNRYPGDPQAVMVAYNAGPGVADKWLAANRDPSVLPAETQKYIGAVDMSAGGMPGYQDWRRSIEGQRQTLQDESADLQRRMKDLEAGDPQQRALADQLLRKQIQLMDKYETMVDHPPTEKPHDMIANFGSIATLIGILGGRFAHRPMVASLNAAGAAMQAMNDNDYQAYQNAFKTWKTQADMTSNLIGMESSTYKNIMDDRRLTMDEKFKEMDAAAKIYQNRLLSQQLEAGEYEKAWEYAQKLDKTKDDHALAQAQIEEAHAKAEKERLEAQFPLLGTGEQRSDLMAELAKEAEEEAKNPKSGQTPRTVQELAQDPAAVQAARQRIELRKAHKDPDEIQSPLLGTTEDRAAIITKLGKQASDDVTKANPDATPAERQAAIKQRLVELANDYGAVDAARQEVEKEKKAGGAAEKATEPKPYIVTSPDGTQQIPKNLAWMGNERQWWDADAGKPYILPTDPQTGKRWTLQQVPHESVFAQNVNQRLEIAANDVSKTMTAMTALPMGTTLGMFGGAQAALSGEPSDNFRKSLLNTATPLQTQLLTTLSNGLSRSLATLAAGGVGTGLVGLAEQLQKDVPQSGDKGLNILMRFADMRQIADAATEILMINPQLNAQQKQKILDMQAQIEKAIPYTTYDIVGLAGTGTPSRESVTQFARRVGAGVPTLTKDQFDAGVKDGTLKPGSAFRKPGDPRTYTVPGP